MINPHTLGLQSYLSFTSRSFPLPSSESVVHIMSVTSHVILLASHITLMWLTDSHLFYFETNVVLITSGTLISAFHSCTFEKEEEFKQLSSRCHLKMESSPKTIMSTEIETNPKPLKSTISNQSITYDANSSHILLLSFKYDVGQTDLQKA